MRGKREVGEGKRREEGIRERGVRGKREVREGKREGGVRGEEEGRGRGVRRIITVR